MAGKALAISTVLLFFATSKTAHASDVAKIKTPNRKLQKIEGKHRKTQDEEVQQIQIVDDYPEENLIQETQQQPPKWVMILVSLLRLAMSFIPVWIKSRAVASRAAALGDHNGEAAQLLETNSMGFIQEIIQRTISRLRAFATSPHAAPVMMSLLIVAIKLVNRVDGQQAEVNAASFENIEEEDEISNEEEHEEDISDGEIVNEEEVAHEIALSDVGIPTIGGVVSVEEDSSANEVEEEDEFTSITYDLDDSTQTHKQEVTHSDVSKPAGLSLSDGVDE